MGDVLNVFIVVGFYLINPYQCEVQYINIKFISKISPEEAEYNES